MSDRTMNSINRYLQSVGINPVYLSAILAILASGYFLYRGDIKNWDNLSNPAKMNDVTLFAVTVVIIIFALLQLFGVLVLRF